jgi:MATE family multidrug resistance protein
MDRNSYKESIRQTFLLSYPVIIGQLGVIMMGVVDSIMVGSLGAAPLAAASLSGGIFILIFIIGIGISISVTPLVAISVGARDYQQCGMYFRQSLVVNFFTGLILMLITILSADLLKYFNQPADVVVLAESYLRILGLSILPASIFHSFKQMIEGLSIMKPAMIITIAANLINAAVNWVLIYGNFGFPALGLDGAGWATFLSRVFMAAALMIYVMNKSYFKQYDIRFDFRELDIPVIKKILRLGLPSGVQYFFEVGAFSFAAIMVGWLGTVQLAAHQIALNLASISFMAILGISAAGGIRVGNAVGERDIQKIRLAGFTALGLGGAFMFFSGLIFIFMRHKLPYIYIDDPDVHIYASSLLIIAALFQISDGVQAVGIGVLRGLTDVKGPTIITFIAYWIIGLPIGYLLGFILNMNVLGIWIGLMLGLTASAIMLSLRFNYKSKEAVSF